MSRTVTDAMRQSKNHKILSFLNDCYKVLADGKERPLGAKSLLKKYSLHNNILNSLAKLKYIHYNGARGPHSMHKWVGRKPDPKMAEEVYVGAASLKKAQNKNNRTLGPANKEGHPIHSSHTNAIKDFLDELYSIMKGAKNPMLASNINFKSRLKKYKLGFAAFKTIVDLEVLKRTGNHPSNFAYTWAGAKPTNEIAAQIHSKERGLINAMNNEKRSKNKPVKPPKDKGKNSDTTKSLRVFKVVNNPTVDTKALWKEVVKKAIEVDDPLSALAALNKL